MLNVFRTPVATIAAAIQDAIEKHGVVQMAIDKDGDVHMGVANSEAMNAYAARHQDLVVTTYTRAINARDLITDIAARMGELSIYGADRIRRKR